MLRIKEILKERGLTTLDVAARFGVSRETVSRQINGNPTLDTLRRYAEFLEVDIGDLFERKRHLCPHCGREIKIEKAD